MDYLLYSRTNQSQKVNFEYGIRPIYYYSRIVGLWPFSITHNLNGVIQTTRISLADGVWFFISLIMFSTATISKFEHIKYMSNLNLMIIIFNHIFHIIGLATGPLIITLDMYNRNKMADILASFTIFDNNVFNNVFVDLNPKLSKLIWFLFLYHLQMSRWKVHFNYKNEYWRACIHIIVPVLLTFIMQTVSFLVFDVIESKQSNYTLTSVFKSESPHILRNSIWIVILYPFIIFIRNLYDRFNALNSLLRFISAVFFHNYHFINSRLIYH